MLSKVGAPPVESDETDLPADLQRELLELQSRGAKMSHYQVLRIDPGADKSKVREAYVDRSKRFHPDRYMRKRLGSFGHLLAEAFKRISDANLVLSDADARAAYDAVLSISLDGPGKQAVEQRALAREEEDRRAAERRRRLFHTKGFARMGAARKLYEEAMAHAADGERNLAVEALKVARQLDPTRREIATKLVELEAGQRKARAFAFVEQGRAHESNEAWAPALKAYQAALQVEPNSAAATLGAARSSLQNHEFSAASSYAARAVEYAPRAAEPKVVLARALMGLGQKAKAKSTLQSLLEQNPEHKEARALLKHV
jgi:curved DNA-binding protein CbpA